MDQPGPPRSPATTRWRERATRGFRRQVLGRVRPFRVAPPLLSRSWPSGPPDFVGVGVQRAGTSWWHSLIEAHPLVHPLRATVKELHFFDDLWSGTAGPDLSARYHAHFIRPPGKRCGEWTPRYMADPWTPPLLARAAPDARLLVLLRDPVTRFRSALDRIADRGGRVDADQLAEAVRRGRYHEQLCGLLRHFPREQVLVLQLERCVLEPEPMYRRTLEFLELPATGLPAIAGRRNESRPAPVPLPDWLTEELRSSYASDLEGLARDFPALDLSLWPSVSAGS